MTPRQQAAKDRRNRKLEAAYERGSKPIIRARDRILNAYSKKFKALNAKYDKAVSQLQRSQHRALKPIDARAEKLIRRTLDKRR